MSPRTAICGIDSNEGSMGSALSRYSRSKTRPRQLLDLPDEILCLILAYCSQEVDFLLWSCPLITSQNGFCHDCYHCSICHGPLISSKLPRYSTATPSSTRSSHDRGVVSSNNRTLLSDNYITNNRNSRITNKCTDSGESSVNGTSSNHQSENIHANNSTGSQIVRKRRRRIAVVEGERTEDQRTINRNNAFSFFGLSLVRKRVQKCPYNSQRQWGDHHGSQQGRSHHYHPSHQQHFWSRHLQRQTTSPSLHHSLLYPVQPNLPLTSSASFSSVAFSFISRNAGNRRPRLLEASNESKTTVILGGSPINAEDNSLSGLQCLSRTRSHYAFDRTNSWVQSTSHIGIAPQMRSMHVVASHANRRRARSMTLAPSTTFGCSFVPSENLIGTTNSFTLDTCNISPSFVMSSANKTEPVNSSREQIAEEYTDTIELSAPFRLLLVNKRFADIAVRSLWEGIVFHGHDAYQVRTLLSTLRDDKYPLTSTRSVVSQSIVADFDHINEDIYQSTSTSALLAFLDENNPVQPCSDLINSVQQSVKRFEGIINQVPSEENIQQPHALTRKSHSHSYYLGPARRHSISGAESTFLETRMLSLPSIISKSPPQYLAPRWSYRQLPRNVVLNFAHPQASPQLLVEVLECIGSYCRDQIKALDLRANEKMQAAGLEVSSELERLFGSGFSNLEYLRLQGGFVDNQLLSALTKGIISSSVALPTKETNSQKIHHQQHRGPGAFPLMSPPCRLSQVFLGPGSVTDSAIAKLIAATSYCLEVFTVTSCVDVGGGALASLLTECQRLRVLAVHKSLARDVELLEGLGYDTNVTPALSNPSGITLSSDPMKSPRKKIVAPLERLELGTVQLTTIGIAEIIKGTSDTLRFIVIETRHFKGSLLKDVIMPMCKKLVGLYFDDPDHYYLYQLQQYRMHRRQPQLHDSCRQSIRLPFSRADSGQAMESEYHHPNSNRRLFKLRRSRTSTAEPRSQSQHSHNLRKDNTITHDEESNSQMHNLWLGKTSTAEWIEYGSCALWAAGVVGVASGYEVNGVHSISNGNGRAAAHSHSTSGSRNRSVSSFFRGIGTRLVSAFSPRRNHNYNGNSINHESVNTSEDTTTILIDHEREINMILARHGVEAAVIDSLCKALVPTLRFFVVMQSDLMPTLSQSPDS